MEITPAISASKSPAATKARTSKVRAAAAPDSLTSVAPSQKAMSTTVTAEAEKKPKKISSPRTAKLKKAVAETESPPANVGQPSAEELTAMIAQAAYFIASQRGFAPGNELEDWFNAERQIMSRFAQ